MKYSPIAATSPAPITEAIARAYSRGEFSSKVRAGCSRGSGVDFSSSAPITSTSKLLAPSISFCVTERVNTRPNRRLRGWPIRMRLTLRERA